MKFEWDLRKADQNLKKHKVSFEDASTVFFDDLAKITFDPDHSEDEERFILLGCSSGLKLLIVCHCYRANDGVIRIISARKATKREAASY